MSQEQTKASSVVKTIWNIVTWAMIFLVVLLAIALVGVRLFGLKPFTVLSGSMEPTYKTGSLVYVKKADYRTLKVGDPITFLLDEKTVATHRIVEIIPDEEDPEILRYRTKGDNNDSPDGGAIHYKNILGKPVFTVPYLGYVANYIQNPPGIYVAIAVFACLIMMVILPDLFEENKKEDKVKKAE